MVGPSPRLNAWRQSSKETSQLAVGDSASDVVGPGIEPKAPAPIASYNISLNFPIQKGLGIKITNESKS